MSKNTTNKNAALVAGQTASKIQLGEAARKHLKTNPMDAVVIEVAKDLAAAGGRKTVNMTDLAEAPATLAARQAEAAKLAENAAPKPAKKAKAEKTDEVATLNWAFRRLRRTALDYITRVNKLDADAKRQFRAHLDTVDESYSAMKTFIDVEKNASLNGDMDDILEEFFGHVIHPGSGNHGVRKAD